MTPHPQVVGAVLLHGLKCKGFLMIVVLVDSADPTAFVIQEGSIFMLLSKSSLPLRVDRISESSGYYQAALLFAKVYGGSCAGLSAVKEAGEKCKNAASFSTDKGWLGSQHYC
ncbi:hypothetical protein FCV25MIE_17517 [Fagus crenata]